VIDFANLSSTDLDEDDESASEPNPTDPANPPRSETSNGWFPYNSKLLFLLDAVDNLPRLRISGSMMRVLLWLLREVGVKKVPSFGALRKSQQNLRKQNGVPTVPCISPKGNAFSFNDPRTLISNVSFVQKHGNREITNKILKDWANPLVCPHLRCYVMIPPNGVISEVWHAQKWRNDMDCHCLSPMYGDGCRHFYIDEPARLKDGTLVIPVQWLEDSNGNMWADAWKIEYDETHRVRCNAYFCY
jgi:hypothetical protein